MEQWRVLRDDSDRFSHTLKSEIVNWLPIDEDSTRAWSVEFIEESENSGLSTSGRTDYGYFLSGRDGEGDPFEDGAVWVVSELDIVKSDGTAF